MQSELVRKDLVQERLDRLQSILAGQQAKSAKRRKFSHILATTSSRDLKVKHTEIESQICSVDEEKIDEERKRILATPVKLLNQESVLVEIPLRTYYADIKFST